MKRYFLSIALATSLWFLIQPSQAAPAGNDNPMGPTGEYNGSITTGGSYDPYTGDAKRFVDDLTVTGSLGAYPLKWTRILNTRNPSPWSHSYQWGLWVKPYAPYHYYDPPYEGPGAQVTYPDGRTLNFGLADQPNVYEGDSNGCVTQDRLVYAQNGNFDLLMRDGGRVKFEHLDPLNGNAYDLVATQIIDPYGLTTWLFRDGARRLSQIVEPGGRYLQINYNTDSSISSIQAFSAPGQLTETVSYYYEGANLRWVYYDDGTHATYTYGSSNVGSAGLLIRTCDDVRFAGPMKQIEYEYMQSGGPYDVAFGQIKREKNFNTHQTVSEVTYPSNHGPPLTDADFQRTETRGDGNTRSFQYTSDGHGELRSYTDFKGQTTQITYSGTDTPGAYRKSLTDARFNTMSTDMAINTDALMKVTHPGDNSTTECTYSDANYPYYMTGRKDENGNWTYHDRDGNNRIWQTRYPDGANETFTYNGFGQVVDHRLTSGGVEHFEYDNRGLKTSYTDPLGNATHYNYYWNDRLQNMVDPYGNATWYEYNQRGQITKVTHQDGTFTQSDYNPDGTLAWSADELGHATSYIYDEYKRVLTVTNPMGQTSTNYYGLDWANPLLHTTSCVKYSLSPMNKNVVYGYDENFRKAYQVQALSTADEAWTWFGYDEVGNLSWTRDPRNNTTGFGYDARNRRTSVTNPLNQTTWSGYDGASNKRWETRADGTSQSWIPDTLNRMWIHYGFVGEATVYDHYASGALSRITDAKGAIYSFGYDLLNRKTSETYPPDVYGASRTEMFWYDAAGRVYLYKNPADQYKYFSYDSRHRERDSWWDSNGPWIHKDFDSASRMTSITTNGSETTVTFGYDDANRQIWEEQTLAGYPTRRVETWLDNDGNRTGLHVPGYYLIRFDHTQGNQLAHIYGGSWEPWFNYSYDAAGNLLKRQDVFLNVNDSEDCHSWNYDPLNRPVEWENTGGGDGPFARSWYQYDSVGREAATWRDEQSGKGEKYWYTATDQLSVVEYNADQVWTGNPQNWNRWVGYSYTPNMLNRASVNDNGNIASYTAGGMNQYVVNGATYNYDYNFNLREAPNWGGTFDAQSRLTVAAHGGGVAYFTYDGLGRCVRRTFNPPGGGSTTVLYTYEGWKPVVEWDGAGNFQAWNIYGPGADELLWRYDVSVGHLRYHHDRHGNVTFLLGAGGEGLERYTYDAFGRPTITDWWGNPHLNAGSEPQSWYGNRFMFQGREYLPEMAIYDYRHRYYLPDLGRFLQVDPTGFDAGDMNLFRYCGDDPADRSDPMGLDSDVYLSRDYPDRDAPGRYVIVNSAHKQIYSGPANQNPFFRNTHGVAAGEYKLVPKGMGWGHGVFDEHQPAITGYANGLKPGQPNKSYTHGPALVHKANPYGTGPDSAGCVTVDPIGEAKTKEVMEVDRKTNGVTRFHISERERKPGEPEIRRAQSVQSRATNDADGLGEGGRTDENSDGQSADQFVRNYLMGNGENSGEGFHPRGPR